MSGYGLIPPHHILFLFRLLAPGRRPFEYHTSSLLPAGLYIISSFHSIITHWDSGRWGNTLHGTQLWILIIINTPWNDIDRPGDSTIDLTNPWPILHFNLLFFSSLQKVISLTGEIETTFFLSFGFILEINTTQSLELPPLPDHIDEGDTCRGCVLGSNCMNIKDSFDAR